MKRLFVFVLALSLQSGAVFAHTDLVRQDPADGSSVAAPTTLSLTFTEEVTLEFTGITLKGPDGAEVTVGEGVLGDDGMTLTIPVPEALPAGAYSVDWHALSEDGHKAQGSYAFTVK